jgi:hypothetical protein
VDEDEDISNGNEAARDEKGPEPTRGAPLSAPYVQEKEECNGEDFVGSP